MTKRCTLGSGGCHGFFFCTSSTTEDICSSEREKGVREAGAEPPWKERQRGYLGLLAYCIGIDENDHQWMTGHDAIKSLGSRAERIFKLTL